MGELQLLTIVVPIDLRDDVIDALSGCACISGFNMSLDSQTGVTQKGDLTKTPLKGGVFKIRSTST